MLFVPLGRINGKGKLGPVPLATLHTAPFYALLLLFYTSVERHKSLIEGDGGASGAQKVRTG